MLVIGNGCVLVGMGERTRPAGVEQLADRLFEAGAAQLVIALDLPERRSAMHLDTVMTMVDADAFTIYPDVRAGLTAYELRPGRTAPSPSAPTTRSRASPPRSTFRSCASSRPAATATRPSASSGTTATTSLALAPGVVVAYERNVATNTLPAPQRHRGDHDRRLRARPRPRRSALHVLPDRPRRRSEPESDEHRRSTFTDATS